MNHSFFTLSALQDAMRSAGINTNFVPQGTGSIERFHVDGDKAGSKNGWLVLHNQGDFSAGCFGSWKDDSSHKWCSKSINDTSNIEQLEFNRTVKDAKVKADNQIVESRKVAGNLAQALWNSATEASSDNPYLTAKAIKPHGIRHKSQTLQVPVYINDAIASLQFINKSGEKKFLKNGEVRGGYFLIGLPTGALLVCEGFATGASLHEATGYAVAVAFNAGNIGRVARRMQQKYPDVNVVICADNDIHVDGKENVGVTAATKAATELGAYIAVPELNSMKCDFNDLKLACGADAVKSAIENAMKSHIQSIRPHQYQSKTPGYEIDKRGVYFSQEKKSDKNNSDEEPELEKIYICGPLQVTAITRSDKNADFGRLLTWRDIDDVEHQWAMPMELLSGDGLQCRSELMRLGLRLWHEPTFRSNISKYILSSDVKDRAICVSKTGWHKKLFVFPDRTLGTSKEQVIFQASEIARHSFEEKGTLDDWKSNVSSLCRGNSRLLFALSCAFAAPLLRLVGDESGGFHIRGSSSNGKTTALKAAASVYGSDTYIQSWRATGNGLEGVAVLHNDCFLPIDELSQVDPKEAGDIAYMLANGKGKARAGRDGLPRAAATWRTLFLSTGEISLADHMLQINKRVKAGQETRMADIPADPGKSLGIFEDLHDCKDGAALSRRMVNAVQHAHGTAGPAFIEAIVGKLDELPCMINAMRKEFIAEVLGVNEMNHGQVIRVAERFALVAVAGELATNLGITGWQPHDAENAVKSCFTAWFESRESGGDLESPAILSQVKAFFEEFGESRFTSLNDDYNHATARREGFSRDSDGGTEFIVLPEIFKSEICSGFNATTVTKLLIEHGWLVTGSDGKAQVRETLPGIGRARCYVFNAAMWAH